MGNNVYNTTGSGQSKTGSKPLGKTITFGISVQNDGTSADSFKLLATGAATSAYSVKYLDGATDITAAVVAGTYTTPSLAAGATRLITVTVKVKSTAAVGSKVTRLVTISSVADPTKKDAVRSSASGHEVAGRMAGRASGWLSRPGTERLPMLSPASTRRSAASAAHPPTP